MKSFLAAAGCILLSATVALGQSQEPPKLRVATVRLNGIMNVGNFHERARLLACDKDTREALRKLGEELKTLQTQLIDTGDEVQLNDLGRKIQFLNQKRQILQQHAMASNPNLDLQLVIRKFIVDNYKDKYAIIMQQDAGVPERFFIWKGNVETDDITDEVTEKFREYLTATLGN